MKPVLADAGDADGVRATGEPPADGDPEHEALRAAPAAGGEADGRPGVDGVRGELPGPAGAPVDAHPEPGADAGVRVRGVARLQRHAPPTPHQRPEAAAGACEDWEIEGLWGWVLEDHVGDCPIRKLLQHWEAHSLEEW